MYSVLIQNKGKPTVAESSISGPTGILPHSSLFIYVFYNDRNTKLHQIIKDHSITGTKNTNVILLWEKNHTAETKFTCLTL